MSSSTFTASSIPNNPQPAAAAAPAALAAAATAPSNNTDDDDDAWDKRIKRTGCFKQNESLLICHADTGDWRKCLAEIAAFKACMKNHGQFEEH
ncbi:hypothetical protein BX661DRAFT_152988 [Kickxella alabastrina]|uniref:uncharacterized protein n=1 Tax=Kickxella alabastrina TaxID=61397 RepID=UPI00221F9620|nr:uncharacterized protein BX661DRAFT_152988 [Kickxella alabastrina]KAI7830080.1 hypothetical protein BX661DRAFT_152988 [Kickxella alabastrina]